MNFSPTAILWRRTVSELRRACLHLCHMERRRVTSLQVTLSAVGVDTAAKFYSLEPQLQFSRSSSILRKGNNNNNNNTTVYV